MSNLDRCVDPSTKIEDIDVVMLTVFTVLTIVVSLPQNYKLFVNKSSEGLSLTTVILTLVFNFTDVAAGILTKWRQLEACKDGWSCYPGVVDLIQILGLTLTTIVIMLQVIWYPPHARRIDRTAATVALIATLIAWGASVAVSVHSPCSEGALVLARVFGTASAVSAVIQYAPQLVETVRHGSSGSLSITMYLVQVLGGLLVVALQAFGVSDPWPVWAPILVSTLMQLAVACLCMYYDLKPRRCQPSECLRDGLLPSGVSSPPTSSASGPPRV